MHRQHSDSDRSSQIDTKSQRQKQRQTQADKGARERPRSVPEEAWDLTWRLFIVECLSVKRVVNTGIDIALAVSARRFSTHTEAFGIILTRW